MLDIKKGGNFVVPILLVTIAVNEYEAFLLLVSFYPYLLMIFIIKKSENINLRPFKEFIK
jgi:hypothetical protein